MIACCDAARHNNGPALSANSNASVASVMTAEPPAGTIPFTARRRARAYYWAGYELGDIAEMLGLNAATVRSWKGRDKWDDFTPLARVEESLDARLQVLIAKEEKTGRDFKEIDLLGRQLERTARVRRYEAPGGHEGDLNPKVANRNAGEKKKAKKNFLSVDDQAKLQAAFKTGLFDYQLKWRDPTLAPEQAAVTPGRDADGKVTPIRPDLLSSTANVTRFILKSRQIGATFYFAREALIRAMDTGNNQIFISASRAQAHIFRQYITAFVAEVTGVKLEGDPIILDLEGVEGPMGEPVKLYFLGTNYRTAQGYHGDVYVDEAFWIYGFEQIDDVAAAMASQKRYRITYFSTPSTIAHQAHRLWSGERFNEHRDKADRGDFKFTPEQLQAGVTGPDGVWRQVVTIEDAEAGGCDLFDIERLRMRYSPDIFDNLFLCKFVDDSNSMFPFALMERCRVDAWDKWQADFNPYALRPFGDGEVWIGYDPAESAAGDDAAMVIIAPPKDSKGKFRVLEKHRMKGLDFEAAAALILKQLDRYNVRFIGIDSTGAGAAVWKLVSAKFPFTKRFDYSVQLKTEMVLKAKNVISAGRLEFDSGARDIVSSFMAIRAELTPSQRQITYRASRAGDTGHADLAWAIMHALYNEPLDPVGAGTSRSRMRISNGAAANDDSPASGGGPRNCGGARGNGQFGRSIAAVDVPLWRSGAGARSPRLPDADRIIVDWPLVRAADPAAGAGPHVQYERASPIGHAVQAQPVAPVLRAVPLVEPQGIRRVRAEFFDDGQWLLRAA